MKKVRQRTDDMLIIRGVNVFPGQIEDVLFKIEGVRPHYLIVVDRKKSLDDLEVRLEVDENVFSDVMGDMVRFQADGGRQAAVAHSACGRASRSSSPAPSSAPRGRRALRARPGACSTCGPGTSQARIASAAISRRRAAGSRRDPRR